MFLLGRIIFRSLLLSFELLFPLLPIDRLLQQVCRHFGTDLTTDASVALVVANNAAGCIVAQVENLGCILAPHTQDLDQVDQLQLFLKVDVFPDLWLLLLGGCLSGHGLVGWQATLELFHHFVCMNDTTLFS